MLLKKINIIIFYLVFIFISIIYIGFVFFPLILTDSCLVICISTNIDMSVIDASTSELSPNVLTQNDPYIILNVQTVPTLIFDLDLEIGEALECGCITATCPQRGVFIFVCTGHSNGLMIISTPN